MSGRLLAAALLLTASTAGCGANALTSPTAVSTTTSDLALFVDRDTGFSTNDVYDAQEQAMRFDGSGALIWTATGERFPGFIADGVVITADRVCASCYFMVRFGHHGGVPRAYLTWAREGTPAVLDVDVAGGQLSVTTSERLIPND